MRQELSHWHYGSLILDPSGNYVLQKDGATEVVVHTFATEDPVEIWLGGQWIAGRIEYGGQKNGYYFLSNEGGFAGLMYGMRARYKG